MQTFLKKQPLLYGVLAALAISILTLSIVRESRHQAEVRMGLAMPAPTINRQTPFSQVPVHGNYQLPYPGILPTHPFYFAKMIRDRVRLIFTFNPEAHTRLLFEYANKRIAAAKILGEQEKLDEAMTVATKAETYFFSAVMNSPAIPPAKQAAWFDELKRASLKHEEIIEELDRIAPDFANNQISRLYKNLSQLREQITSFSHQPFNYPRPEDFVSPASESAVPNPSTKPSLFPEIPRI